MVAYMALGLPLVHRIGQQTLGDRSGLVAAWLTAISPLLVAHAQLVRPDTASFLFGMLAIQSWQLLQQARLWQTPVDDRLPWEDDPDAWKR